MGHEESQSPNSSWPVMCSSEVGLVLVEHQALPLDESFFVHP